MPIRRNSKQPRGIIAILCRLPDEAPIQFVVKMGQNGPLYDCLRFINDMYTANGHNLHFPYTPSPAGDGWGGGSKVQIMTVDSIFKKIMGFLFPLQKVLYGQIFLIDIHCGLMYQSLAVGRFLS